MKSKKRIAVLVTLMCLLVSMIPMNIKATETTDTTVETANAENTETETTESTTEVTSETEGISGTDEPAASVESVEGTENGGNAAAEETVGSGDGTEAGGSDATEETVESGEGTETEENAAPEETAETGDNDGTAAEETVEGSDATESVTFTQSVLHNGSPLEGATIELFDAETGDRLGSSDTGKIETIIGKNITLIEQKITLPIGYQFTFDSEINENGQAVCDVVYTLDGNFESWYDVTNPSIDGILTANKSVIELQVGDTINLEGAYDSKYDDFQLFLVKDSVTTRTYASVTSVSPEYLEFVQNTCFIKALKAGQTKITFESEGAVGSVDVIITEKTTDQENTITSDGGTFHVTGKQNVLPAGSIFKGIRIEEGDTYEKARKLIAGQALGFEVYEFYLSDSQGVAITQLDDYVSVTMPIPNSLSVGDGRVITVYRIETDGSLTECKSSVEGSQITFQTNHFSTYLFALKDTTEVADNSDNNANKDASVDSNGVQASSTTNTDTTETVNQKVVPPKTAESTNLMVMLLIMALGIGFVGTAMRRQNRI